MIGAQRTSLRRIVIADDLQRMVGAAQIGQTARFQQAALAVQLRRQQGIARTGNDLHGLFRLARHQINGRQIGGDAGLDLPQVQTFIDLILQQLSGLIQQIKSHQTLCQFADHPVTIRADRC